MENRRKFFLENEAKILHDALRVKTLTEIKNLYLEQIAADSNLTLVQKLLIKDAAQYVLDYEGNGGYYNDGIMQGILFISFEQMGLGEEDLIPFSPAEREQLLAGFIDVCKAVINEERTRLNNLIGLPSSLPVDWHLPKEEEEPEEPVEEEEEE